MSVWRRKQRPGTKSDISQNAPLQARPRNSIRAREHSLRDWRHLERQRAVGRGFAPRNNSYYVAAIVRLFCYNTWTKRAWMSYVVDFSKCSCVLNSLCIGKTRYCEIARAVSIYAFGARSRNKYPRARSVFGHFQFRTAEFAKNDNESQFLYCAQAP